MVVRMVSSAALLDVFLLPASISEPVTVVVPQARLDEDWEMGIAIKEQVLPRAVEWFTGEAVPPEYDEDMEGEYDEFEDQ